MEANITQQVEHLFVSIKNQLANYQYLKKDKSPLNTFPVTNKQCLYIVNWKESACTYNIRCRKVFGLHKRSF